MSMPISVIHYTPRNQQVLCYIMKQDSSPLFHYSELFSVDNCNCDLSLHNTNIKSTLHVSKSIEKPELLFNVEQNCIVFIIYDLNL